MKEKLIKRKGWVISFSLIVVCIIGAVIWYTQFYTSEWGKGLSKEDKILIEHASETSKGDLKLADFSEKEIASFYSEFKAAGYYPTSLQNHHRDVVVAKRSDNYYAAVPTLLYNLQEDFKKYKKQLRESHELSAKTNKLLPYKQNSN